MRTRTRRWAYRSTRTSTGVSSVLSLSISSDSFRVAAAAFARRARRTACLSAVSINSSRKSRSQICSKLSVFSSQTQKETLARYSGASTNCRRALDNCTFSRNRTKRKRIECSKNTRWGLNLQNSRQTLKKGSEQTPSPARLIKGLHSQSKVRSKHPSISRL